MSLKDEILMITNNSLLLEIFIALTIFILSLIVGKIVGKIVIKTFEKTQLNDLIKKNTKKKISIDKIVANFLTYAIYVVGFIWALEYLGLATTILNLLSGAILIVTIIIIFLALKDFIPSITAGLFIHAKGFLREGDIIKLHDIEGKIISLNLVETKVKTKSGDLIFIPNSRLTKYEVIKRK